MLQTIQKRYKNLFISLALTGILVALSFLFFYPDHSGLGKGFGVAILFMIVRYIALYAGILLLIAKLVKFLKKTDNILYIFFGTINFLIGAIYVILYFMGDSDKPWFYKCLFNLVIGMFMIADAFVAKKAVTAKQDNT